MKELPQACSGTSGCGIAVEALLAAFTVVPAGVVLAVDADAGLRVAGAPAEKMPNSDQRSK